MDFRISVPVFTAEAPDRKGNHMAIPSNVYSHIKLVPRR